MTRVRNVLVVEDEPLIAMMLEDFLEELGHRQIGSADTVTTALALVERGGFDAVILDVNLRGGERCWPVADALAARGMPFVLATGGGDDMIADAHRGRPRLPKPYTMDAIQHAIETL